MLLLDLPGPAFLGAYVPVMIAATAGAVALRRSLRGPQDAAAFVRPLAPIEVAYLARGPRGAFYAALTSLTRRGVLSWHATHRFLHRNRPVSEDVDAVERAVAEAIPEGGAADLDRRQLKAQSALDRVRSRLERYGLLLDTASARRARWLPAALPALVLLWTVARLIFGDMSDGLVIFLVPVGVGVTLAFATRQAVRTRRGDKMLQSLRERHAALRETARTANEGLEPQDAALAFGLFGPMALDAELRRVVAPPDGGSGSSGGCGSCGSSWSDTGDCGSDGGSDGGGGCGGGCGGD